MMDEHQKTPTTTERKDAHVNPDVDISDLFRKYGLMIVRRCSQLLGNDDDGADAAQDVFIKVISDNNLQHIKQPGRYLFIVATNYCLDLLRNKSPWGGNRDGISLEKIAGLESGEAIEDRISYRGILRKLFNRHPESSRTIAVLHFIDGLAYEDVAKMVGMSVNGVRKRLQRLRSTLKEMNVL